MLCTETRKSAAILRHVSFATTVYGVGGNGVGVGTGVSVAVGIRVAVGSGVMVAVGVGVPGLRIFARLPLSAMYTRPIPTRASRLTRTNNNTCDEARRGRARVRPVTDLPGPAATVRSVPQTRHLVAAAPTRVPHVGQSRGPAVGGAGVFGISRKRRAICPGVWRHYTTQRFRQESASESVLKLSAGGSKPRLHAKRAKSACADWTPADEGRLRLARSDRDFNRRNAMRVARCRGVAPEARARDPAATPLPSSPRATARTTRPARIAARLPHTLPPAPDARPRRRGSPARRAPPASGRRRDDRPCGACAAAARRPRRAGASA